MRTKKALSLLLVALTLLSVAGAAFAAPKEVIVGSGISAGGVTVTGGSSSESSSQTSGQTGTIVNCSSWVSLRKSASSTSSRIAKLKKDTTVTVLGTSGSYYKVSYNGKEGYVSSQYVQLNSGSNSSNGISGGNGSTSSAQMGTIVNCESWVSLRKSASSDSSRVAKLNKGVSVTVLSTSGSYYKVSFDGKEGYVSSKYVQLGGSNSSNSSNSGSSNGSISGGNGSTSSLEPVNPSNSGSQSVGKNRYAKYTGTSADRWGTIQVPGTNINTYIYCNALDSKGNFRYNAYSSSVNYVYAMSYYDDPIAVITGHNMRVSQTGLHALHHVQNAWLGKTKCDYTKRCSATCTDCKTSTFNIRYNGSSQWQLVCFYEIDKSTVSSASARKKILYLNCFNSTVTGELKQQWLNSQFSYATSAYRGMKVSNASSSDKLMILMTCADSSGNDYQRLYMVLKAVG